MFTQSHKDHREEQILFQELFFVLFVPPGENLIFCLTPRLRLHPAFTSLAPSGYER